MPRKPKVYVLLLGLSLVVSPSFAQSGIQFFQGSWDEALTEARQQKKIIFVDAYTEWCGPCKAMSRNTFTDAAVGEFYNKNFVNYKFNMEKGEGPMFASKYQVNAYPTLLYIDPKGELVHRALGYKVPDAFLAEGRKANDPSNKQNLLELEMEEGDASPDDLLNYARNLKYKGEDYSEPAREYFADLSPKQLRSPENWKAIQELSGDLDGPEFQYLVLKQKKFAKLYGKEAVYEKIKEVLRKETIAATLLKNEAKYAEASRIAGQLKDKDQMASYLKVVHAEAEKDWADYAFKAIHHYNTYSITDARELDQVVNNFVNKVPKRDQLMEARDWARQSVALRNEAYNNATFAKLLLQLNDYQQALRMANKAVQLALQQGEDPEAYEALVEQIQDKLRE